MPDDDSPVPEGLELHKDGTITAVLAGERYRLRRPKFGELRDLRERYNGIENEHLLLQADYAEQAPERPGEDASKRALAEYAIGVREAQVALGEKIEAKNGEWIRHAFALLGAKLPDDVDEWESWLLVGETRGLLINHWRTVPLARGAG